MERDEIGIGGDGLTGETLVVLGLLGLLVIGLADAEESVGAFGAVGVFVGGALKGTSGFGQIGEELLLVGQADVDLCLRGNFAVRTVLDDLLVHLDRLFHGGKPRHGIEELEPLPGQITVRNGHLPQDYFLVVGRLGIFFDEFLVGIEGFLVVVGRFVASAQEVLGLGSIIGKWPDMDGAAGRVHGGRIVLFVEGLLGDLQLVLGPATGPRTAPASLFVAPP